MAVKVKVTVNLSTDDVSFLSEVAAERGCTKTEVLRRALALQGFIERELRLGSNFLIEGKHGVQRLVFR